MKIKYLVLIQAVVLVLVLTGIYLAYPRTSFDMQGQVIKFSSSNAKVIIIADNPNFEKARAIELDRQTEISLEPGTYYWKSANGIIQGITHEFTISSQVGLKIEKNEDNASLVNVGNVRINVTKDAAGGFVGEIILEPDNSQNINDSGVYEGRQAQ